LTSFIHIIHIFKCNLILLHSPLKQCEPFFDHCTVTSLIRVTSIEYTIIVFKCRWCFIKRIIHDKGIVISCNTLWLSTRFPLRVFTIIQMKALFAECPVTVNYVTQSSKVSSSPFDNICCDSRASLRLFPSLILRPNVARESPRLQATWYGVLWIPAVPSTRALCIPCSVWAAFLLGGLLMTVDSVCNFNFVQSR
jgi:hypothetical protein